MLRAGSVLLLLGILSVYGQNHPFEWKSDAANRARSRLAKTQFDSTDIFDVLHTRLDLNFPYESSAFSGSVTLTCRALDTLEGIDLHMGDLTADHIFMRGESVLFAHDNEILTLMFPRAVSMNDTFSIKIEYYGAPSERGFYFYDRCAYTMSEPEDARYWFPCHDVPWDKATAELWITVPTGVEAASIGLLESRTKSPDGSCEIFHWSTDYPVATYLICVTLSDEYVVWSDWFVTETGDSLEMPYYVFTEDSAKSKIDVKNMRAAMAFFTSSFGFFPFGKYGTATVTKAWFGGMEHQTMTTVVQNWFQGDGSIEEGFVHELAHMWWGDAVTLSDWPEIWLNEGFATYSQLLFTEYYYGDEVFRSDLQNHKQTYIKGAWVLHMLRHVVGDVSFFDILTEYYDLYKYNNASIRDFQTVCESVYGQSVDWFFEEWLYRTGYMQLAYDWENDLRDNGTYQIRLAIQQRHASFVMPVDIRIHTFGFDIDTTLWISASSQRFTFILPDSAIELRLDPEGEVLMTDTLTEELVPDYILPEPVLSAVSPNPVGVETWIQYVLPWNRVDWSVRLDIFNIRGQRIRTLVNEKQTPETYSLLWDGTNASGHRVASGMYFVKLHADQFLLEQKMTVIR